MSRNLVTVKTKHGHIRVPADKAPKAAAKPPFDPGSVDPLLVPYEREPVVTPEPPESDDDVPG